jgi:hypothetical protein
MSRPNLMKCGCPTYKKESVLTLGKNTAKLVIFEADRILTDGGGIRGLVSLLILQRILEFIRDEERECDRQLVKAGLQAPRADGRDNTEVPLACHYFSFMFGTSTGGYVQTRRRTCVGEKEGSDVNISIIAIMLGRLRMSIKDCIDTYCDLGGEVFGKKQPFHFLGQNKYDCTKLERIIREVVRRNNHGSTADDPLIADSSVLNKSHNDKQERVQNRCIPCRVYVLTQYFVRNC